MGFKRLHKKLLALDGPRADAMRLLLTSPSLCTSLCINYESHFLLQPILDKEIEACLVRCLTQREDTNAPSEFRPLLEHVVEQFRLHVHASDPEVKRWATIATELHSRPAAFEFLVDVCDHLDERIALAVRSAISYTISESIRRKVVVIPF